MDMCKAGIGWHTNKQHDTFPITILLAGVIMVERKTLRLSATLLLVVVIVSTGRIPRPIGYLMGVSGLAYIAQGWIIGSEGFSANNTLPTLIGITSRVANDRP
jgi:hypothetical protein